MSRCSGRYIPIPFSDLILVDTVDGGTESCQEEQHEPCYHSRTADQRKNVLIRERQRGDLMGRSSTRGCREYV